MALAFCTDSSKNVNGDLNFDTNLFANRPTDCEAEESIDDHYEIQRCVLWIQENSFLKVALQFPDQLLHCADVIALKLLEKVQSALIYVLADTSYSSCCVDEVAAEHAAADAIIHFGPACLTPCNRLPVLYIFGKQIVDVQHVAQEFLDVVPNTSMDSILIFDVSYFHASDSIYKTLSQYYLNLCQSELIIPTHGPTKDHASSDDNNYCVINGRRLKLKKGLVIEDYVLFFIGQEGPLLTKLLMTLNRCQLFSYDPHLRRARKESVNVNKLLQKRYYAVEKARDSRIVGILMGTLGMSRYLDVIERLKSVARHAGKKTYTIVVGRLNPSKLANFPEIDVFVFVACPDNSLLDSKEFYRPIITPFEFELACVENRQWTGEYITDFRELMPGASHYVPLNDLDQIREPSTNVSLITGRLNLISGRANDDDSSNSDRTLAKKDDHLTVAQIHNHSAGEYLMNRTWRGLNGDQTATVPVSVIQQGASGTASAYNHENNLMGNKDFL